MNFLSKYDLFCFGNLSIDIIKTPQMQSQMTGGAILHALWTAYQMQANVAGLVQSAKLDKYRLQEFPPLENNLFWNETPITTSILNYYPTKDNETRICTNIANAGSFNIKKFPEFSAELISYNGLLTGEIDLHLLRELSKRGKLVVDAQGLLREVKPNMQMEYSKNEAIEEILPLIHYFKLDAAEAGYLTSIDTTQEEGRKKAALEFRNKGIKEVIISHNKELSVLNEDGWYTAPFKNRNLDGRTGRGDTCTTSYVLSRLKFNSRIAINFAAALTSLKMEHPGPFMLNLNDVYAFLKENY